MKKKKLVEILYDGFVTEGKSHISRVVAQRHEDSRDSPPRPELHSDTVQSIKDSFPNYWWNHNKDIKVDNMNICISHMNQLSFIDGIYWAMANKDKIKTK